MLETKRGREVAETGRFFNLQENQDRYCRELQEAIEHMKEKRSGLLETVEREQKLMSGAREEIRKRVFQDVLVLEDKITEVENELHEASEEMRRKQRRRVSDTARVVLGGKVVSGAQSSAGEA